MVPKKLPLDLEEEILFRVPPRSLVRFRSVCREWNTLFNNKRFINKNFACGRPEIMLNTHSHIYSINVDFQDENPTIKVRDLRFDHLSCRGYHLYGICDGNFFIYSFLNGGGGVVWNPLLWRQTKWIAKAENTCGKAIGYDGSRPEKSYKIIGRSSCSWQGKVTDTYSVFEFATNAWKVTDHTRFHEKPELMNDSGRVSLNGNLYWTAYNSPHTGQYFIQMLDFSKEIEKSRKIFCFTVEIEIWVTKDKIGNGDDGDDVVWIKFMTVSRPDFPILLSHISTSYFVDNDIYGKSFVLCCPSKRPKAAWVYIVRGDLCKKIKIDQVLCEFQSSVYVPSLITIP
ncbi:putative F-box protein [Arabidopsis thaliana]|uniref:F-box domain-containing protein n=1 Tax=Arabidopsis thaliana TaxID=3702 RepID=A0A178WDW0_ARATH|nr:hypothetical protein AXX17_AT1G52050 [Arabidopsis thaliana]